MSYLSASGNVGYSGLSQISDASCATQYKMGVDGAGTGSNCGEDEDLSYYPHVNEQLFASKYKVDSAELFTFQDTDGVAGEITVCDESDVKATSPMHSTSHLTNGLSDDITQTTPLTNGHVLPSNYKAVTPTSSRSPGRRQNIRRANSISEILASVGPNSPPGLAIGSPNSIGLRNSITSVSKEKTMPFSSTSSNQSFLDVFKKEMGTFTKNPVKKDITLVHVTKSEIKPAIPKKTSTALNHRARKASNAGGRGPAQHEALQRIPTPVTSTASTAVWHAPGPHLFECTPLNDMRHPTQSSGSDDDCDMPNFGTWVLSSGDTSEPGRSDTRGARLAARRAALRRQVVHAAAALRLTPSHAKQIQLVHAVKKHLSHTGVSGHIPSKILGELLAARGMTSVLTTRERRKLRSVGWSQSRAAPARGCAAPNCRGESLPCAAYCLTHVTLAPEQTLYTSCAAVFAGGARCRQPVLQLQEQTPLCREHAWKRDNYDKLSREPRPAKPPAARKRASGVGGPRRAKRRRRPPPARPAPAPTPPSTTVHHDLNVCSNSSAHDSSEDTGIGGLSETEFMTGDHLDVSVVDHVLEASPAPDDILDSSVLHQIPDEAFTEFFNQSGGGAVDGFCEEGSEELARALEAVLDGRVLDSLTDVFTQPVSPPHKVVTPKNSVVEMSSSANS